MAGRPERQADPAGEEISFQYQLQDVPEGAENVTIRFTE
jgi:hypothetical protein